MAVGKSWANVATWLIGGLAAWGLVLSGLLDLSGVLLSPNVDQTTFAIDAGSIVSGVAAGGFLLRPIRKDVAAVIPIDVDNPVHTLALVLATILFGTQLAGLLFTDVLGYLATQRPETIQDMLLDELPFLVLAFAGVGLFVRRNALGATVRLGFVRPAWWHLVLAAAAAGLFLAALQGFDSANHLLFPDIARHIDAVDQHLFSQLVNSSWIGIVTIAVLPGVCEEALFRGALQPRLGLVPAAVLFTSIHSQYALSFDLLGIFVIAICLGLIRKYTNTTTSMSAHVTYNLLASISLTGTILYVAVGIEALLIVVLVAVAIVARRRTSLDRQAGQ